MARRSGGTITVDDEMTSLPTLISPPSGSRNPAIKRSVVVFPQPEGPKSQTNAPSPISRWRLSTAGSVANFLVNPTSDTVAIALFSRRNQVPTQEPLDREYDEKRNRQQENTQYRDRADLSLLLKIEDDNGYDLRARGEKQYRCAEFADDAEKNERYRAPRKILRFVM